VRARGPTQSCQPQQLPCFETAPPCEQAILSDDRNKKRAMERRYTYIAHAPVRSRNLRGHRKLSTPAAVGHHLRNYFGLCVGLTSASTIAFKHPDGSTDSPAITLTRATADRLVLSCPSGVTDLCALNSKLDAMNATLSARFAALESKVAAIPCMPTDQAVWSETTPGTYLWTAPEGVELEQVIIAGGGSDGQCHPDNHNHHSGDCAPWIDKYAYSTCTPNCMTGWSKCTKTWWPPNPPGDNGGRGIAYAVPVEAGTTYTIVVGEHLGDSSITGPNGVPLVLATGATARPKLSATRTPGEMSCAACTVAVSADVAWTGEAIGGAEFLPYGNAGRGETGDNCDAVAPCHNYPYVMVHPVTTPFTHSLSQRPAHQILRCRELREPRANRRERRPGAPEVQGMLVMMKARQDLMMSARGWSLVVGRGWVRPGGLFRRRSASVLCPWTCIL
jgi:hypothetical protein